MEYLKGASLAGIASIILLCAVSFLPSRQIRFDPTLLPLKGADFLRAQIENDNGAIFNAYDWGGYLAYSLYPTGKVFIHGLNDHYGLKLLDQYSKILTHSSEGNALLEAYRIKWIVFPTQTYLTTRLLNDPRWKAVYQDSTCVIFKRLN